MKRTHFFSLTIITFLFTILATGCGSDDDNRSAHTFKATCEAKYPIRGYAGDKIISDTPTVYPLNDMLKDNDYITPIISGKLYPNKNTALEIVGLKPEMSIKEITIVINGLSRTYKNINSENANLYTTELVDYMNRTFTNMIKQQQLRVLVSFTLDQNISEEDNVYIKIAYDGEFTYLK